MAFLVYKLTNSANGKAYIGITSRSLDARWAEHRERARQGKRDSRLHVAMRKYGEDTFSREIVATAETDAEVRELEQRFIREFDTYERGYNCNLGGNGHLHFPEHIRRKIGDAQRGKVIPSDVREKMAVAKRERPSPHHLGDHLTKGSTNPRAVGFAMSCPGNILYIGRGLRAFARKYSLHYAHLRARGHSNGFYLIDRFTVAAPEAVSALT